MTSSFDWDLWGLQKREVAWVYLCLVIITIDRTCYCCHSARRPVSSGERKCRLDLVAIAEAESWSQLYVVIHCLDNARVVPCCRPSDYVLANKEWLQLILNSSLCIIHSSAMWCTRLKILCSSVASWHVIYLLSTHVCMVYSDLQDPWRLAVCSALDHFYALTTSNLHSSLLSDVPPACSLLFPLYSLGLCLTVQIAPRGDSCNTGGRSEPLEPW